MLLLPVAFAAIAVCGKAVATASAIACCCMPRLYVVAVAQLLHVVAVLATGNVFAFDCCL